MPGQMQRDVTASGVRLRVVEAGEGAPVILLHGVFFDHRTWDRVLDNLSEVYRVVAPDLPGFGASEKPPLNRYGYRVNSFAETVADLYGGLEFGPATIVGHGLGGAIALAVAAQHPELVSSLVLVDALVYPGPLDFRRRIALLPIVGGFVFKQLWGKSTFRAFYRQTLVSNHAEVSNERIDSYYRSFSFPAARGSALATLRGALDTRPIVAHTSRIQTPTLVVWGQHDRVYPPALGQRLARELRDCSFALLDAGHAPQEEKPLELAQLIRRFLRGQRLQR